MELDGSDHHLSRGLAPGVAVGLELVPKSMGFSRQLLKVARQIAKPLLDTGLVLAPRMKFMMGLEVQWDS